MERAQLKEKLSSLFSGIEIKESGQFLEMELPLDRLHDCAIILKNTPELHFDYLFCLTGIDLPECFEVVYHFESSIHRHQLVIKVKTPGREDAAIDTVSDIWPTAEFHEREVYDLFGIKFNNHNDLRRLFLDEGWGFPLRKDYRDEINIIER